MDPRCEWNEGFQRGFNEFNKLNKLNKLKHPDHNHDHYTQNRFQLSALTRNASARNASATNTCYKSHFEAMATDFATQSGGGGVRRYANDSCVLLDLDTRGTSAIPTLPTLRNAKKTANAMPPQDRPLLYAKAMPPTKGKILPALCIGRGDRAGKINIESNFLPTGMLIHRGSYGKVYEYDDKPKPKKTQKGKKTKKTESGTETGTEATTNGSRKRKLAVKMFNDPDDYNEEKSAIMKINKKLRSILREKPAYRVVVTAMYNDDYRVVVMPRAQGSLSDDALPMNSGALASLAWSSIMCALALLCASLFQADWKVENMLYHKYGKSGNAIVVIGDIGGIVECPTSDGHWKESSTWDPRPNSTYTCPYAFDPNPKLLKDNTTRTYIQSRAERDLHLQWCIGCMLMEMIKPGSAGISVYNLAWTETSMRELLGEACPTSSTNPTNTSRLSPLLQAAVEQFRQHARRVVAVDCARMGPLLDALFDAEPSWDPVIRAARAARAVGGVTRAGRVYN